MNTGDLRTNCDGGEIYGYWMNCEDAGTYTIYVVSFGAGGVYNGPIAASTYTPTHPGI